MVELVPASNDIIQDLLRIHRKPTSVSHVVVVHFVDGIDE
jgi:hypothetical protein